MKEKNIIDYFNSHNVDFIIKKPWMIENKNLTNFCARKASISVSSTETEYLGIDIGDHLVNAIKNEINQDFYKIIYKNLFDTRIFDYLDFSKYDKPTTLLRSENEQLVDIILNNGYKNIITNAFIGAELQDNKRFVFNSNFNSLGEQIYRLNYNPGLSYHIGKIGYCDIYIDPLMSFDDCRICMFDSIDFNIEKMNASASYHQATFAPSIIIDYEISNNTTDSKLIFVLFKNSESFFKYKSLQRDIKIDNILE